MRTSIKHNNEQTQNVAKILTGSIQNLKEKFVQKMKLNYKTLKKAFYELDRHK